MDTVTLSRVQFALTIGYHILWPTFSIGIACFVAWLSVWWWRTGDAAYRDLMRFWSRLFAMGFGMGVITGVVISYDVGTNWSGFARVTANVLGPLFMYEVLTAFFLEAGFIGIVLFGEGRVSRGAHLFACCMVAGGTLLSACLILATKSWMQTPAGATLGPDGIFRVDDWAAVIFTASYPYRVAHMVCASFLTGAFVVAGVSAFHLLRGIQPALARRAFSMAMWAALVLAPLQLVIGDLHGRNTLRYQPTKLAAMEGLWPYVVPRSVTIWDGAADAASLSFASVGLIVVIPVVLTYQIHAYWVFRGKVAAPQDPATDARTRQPA